MEKLKELRLKANVSQQVMADFLGVSRPAYTMYEIGKREPSHDTLQKLANFFNVSVDYLLGRSETPVPETQVQHNTELAVLFNKLRKDPLAVEVVKFFLNLSPEKKEAAKTVLFTAFGE